MTKGAFPPPRPDAWQDVLIELRALRAEVDQMKGMVCSTEAMVCEVHLVNTKVWQSIPEEGEVPTFDELAATVDAAELWEALSHVGEASGAVSYPTMRIGQEQLEQAFQKLSDGRREK